MLGAQRGNAHRGIPMNLGDYVFVTQAGELRILPKEAQGRDGRELAGSSDQFVGVIAELRDNPEDTVVAMEPSEPHVMPVYATIGKVREIYG